MPHKRKKKGQNPDGDSEKPQDQPVATPTRKVPKTMGENLHDQLEDMATRVNTLESTCASLEREFKRFKTEHDEPKSPVQVGESADLVQRIEVLENTLKGKKPGLLSLLTRPLWTANSYPTDRSKSAQSITSSTQAKDSSTPVISSQEDFKCLLKNMNFGSMSHIKTLCKYDARHVASEAHIFCDFMSAAEYDIDWVIQRGPKAMYIQDSLKHSCSPRYEARLGKLGTYGLAELRIVELSYNANIEQSVHNSSNGNYDSSSDIDIPADLPVGLPRYVYDMGQLCLHHRSGRCKDNHTIIPTMYNVVIDMGSPEKPVWLVTRPETEAFRPRIPMALDVDESGRRLIPHQDAIPPGSSPMMKLATTIRDLDLSSSSANYDSYPLVHKAGKLMDQTRLETHVQVEFAVPDIDEMWIIFKMDGIQVKD